MTDEHFNLISAMNTLARDYLQVSIELERKKSTQFLKLLSLLKQKRYKDFFHKLYLRMVLFFRPLDSKETLYRGIHHDFQYNKEDYELENFFQGEKPKVVIYSHISNGYDNIKNPVLFNRDYDYVLYTDIPEDQKEYNTIWEWRPIPDTISSQGSNNVINRTIKFNPKELFPNHDIAVYIDGTIKILSDITPLIKVALESKTGLGLHAHMFRDCLYSEAEACIRLKRGITRNLKTQVEDYQKEGFPSHFGLFEASVIISNLNNQIALNLLTEWYNDFCTRGSMRDQLSLPYIIWKNGFSKSDIGLLGYNIDKNPLIKRFAHN